MNEEQFNKFMEAITKSVKKYRRPSIKYAILSAQLKDTRVNQPCNNFYRGGRPQINYKWERKGELKCYNCSKIEHAAKNCMSEKTKYLYPDQRKDNYNKTKTISFCEIEETNNNEVYMLDNITSQKTKKCLADPKWEGKLRKESTSVQDPTPLNKTKGKRRLSKIDSLNPYNVADDILALPTSATVGQNLQYPNQRRNLAKILKCPVNLKETNFLYPEEQRCTTAARCYIRIRNSPVLAVLDSGAVISIISKCLLDKLGLNINDKPITVEVVVPTTLYVIESLDDTLLLETEWFQKTKARIHFDEQKLYLKYADRLAEIKISNSGNEDLKPRKDEDNYSEDRDTFDEFDYEEKEFDEIEQDNNRS
ncbi:31934_t:CDS:2 [Gigaspora margarita]|uniref:31934_t:CDS:1 n=1 Tax=Gigaspora margarita TaxID=4874 RepID=A0ABM8W2W4_GIGMA|nr:31934_t:CDS:2 [Gigaspora margarita]